MRSIRKIQSDCHVLSLFENEEYLNRNYKGILFDKVKRTDMMFQYNVFIPELKIMTRLNTLDEYDNYSEHDLKLFMFKQEHNVRQKIKVQCITSEPFV